MRLIELRVFKVGLQKVKNIFSKFVETQQLFVGSDAGTSNSGPIRFWGNGAVCTFTHA
jgi:hypothetical protein